MNLPLLQRGAVLIFLNKNSAAKKGEEENAKLSSFGNVSVVPEETQSFNSLYALGTLPLKAMSVSFA